MKIVVFSFVRHEKSITLINTGDITYGKPLFHT